MIRPTLSRRTLAGGVAVCAVASLTLGATGASASSLGATHFAQVGPASDISLSIAQQSPLITNSAGSFILGLLQNPAAGVPVQPGTAFAAAAVNAAGAVIGAATVGRVGHVAIEPGGQQLYEFDVPAGTDHIALTNASAVQDQAIADPLNLVGALTMSTDSVGYTTVTGTLSNPSAFAQRPDITIIARNAAGQIVGADSSGYTTPGTVPGGASAPFTDTLGPSQSAGATSYTAILDGNPDSSISTDLTIPFYRGTLVLGSSDTIQGSFFTSGGQSKAGRLLQFVARTNGVPSIIGTTTTGGDGTYTFHVKLPTNAQFSIVHPSDSTTFGTSTGDFYFPLTPVLTISHLKAKTLTATKHKTFQITGSFPGFTGEKIYLELRNAKGHYTVVTFTHVGSHGEVVFKGSKLKQSKAGKYTYRVEAQAGGLHGDVSSTFTVKVS